MTATINRPTAVAAPPPPVELKKDPRYLALRNFALSISIFAVFGYTILGFEQPWLWPFLALATGYSTEITMELVQAWFERRRPRFIGVSTREKVAFLLPAHITSLAVNMLLYANSRLAPVLFGVVVGVAGKAILQAPIKGRMRHFMNPSNLGITTTLLLFNWVSIAPPYMFTEHVGDVFRIAIPMLIITAGTLINAKLTGRTMLIVGFLGGFVIQALVRWWIWDIAFYSALAVMTGVAFVLFTNYMISDPGTTPFKSRPQFIFGGAVAITYGTLMAFNIVYTLFFATTIVCAARGLGWWGAHLWNARVERARVRAHGAGPTLTVAGQAVAA
jgi:enediyne biosynthesis protein E5